MIAPTILVYPPIKYLPPRLNRCARESPSLVLQFTIIIIDRKGIYDIYYIYEYIQKTHEPQSCVAQRNRIAYRASDTSLEACKPAITH